MNGPKTDSSRELESSGLQEEQALHTGFKALAGELAEIGRQFYARGWVLGTSGNFSAVVNRRPLRLAITSTGLDKGLLTGDQFLEIDEAMDARPPRPCLTLPLSAIAALEPSCILTPYGAMSSPIGMRVNVA
jgi:hypothetical protein